MHLCCVLDLVLPVGQVDGDTDAKELKIASLLWTDNFLVGY